MTDACQHFATQTRDYESRFLSTFWYCPEKGWRAASDAGLETSHFWFSEHKWLFGVLCESYLQGVKLTFADVQTLNGMSGKPFADGGFPSLLHICLYSDTMSTSLGTTSKGVMDMARRRNRLGKLEATAWRILTELAA